MSGSLNASSNSTTEGSPLNQRGSASVSLEAETEGPPADLLDRLTHGYIVSFVAVGGTWQYSLEDAIPSCYPVDCIACGGSWSGAVTVGSPVAPYLYEHWAWTIDPFYDGALNFVVGTPNDCALGLGLGPDTTRSDVFPPLTCGRLHEGGSLSSGPNISYSGSCQFTATPAAAPAYTEAHSLSLAFKEPACQRIGKVKGDMYDRLQPGLKAGLTKLYELIVARNGCFRFSSGYRDQQQIYDRWHHIADQHGPADHRTADQVDTQLHQEGFAQDVPATATGQPIRNHGAATGGPCNPSKTKCPHSAGEAADIRWWWRPFGELPFKNPTGKFTVMFLPLMRELVTTAGLCGPPTVDPVHIELPVQQGKRKPSCRRFTTT